ncbi:hypothetical protein TNCV_4396531 [Trichonephila clavipes]|uniref:Uncharacterized protein n=1 Tax=Trichonephila clavipes TaxID=2585209 RepID=A0A8X7BDZ2_TRICX|nr:hypothetical protein TNCV_4396531 [Trichonephila clavipes]
MSSFLGFCEGDTRNRWRDGQVCPDVGKELWRLGPDGSGVFWRWTSVFRCGQGTMAPWARRLGCVLACYVPIRRRRRSRETLDGRKKRRGDRKGEVEGKRTRESGRENGRREEERRKRERGDGKRVGERDSEARLEWRKRAESGNWRKERG